MVKIIDRSGSVTTPDYSGDAAAARAPWRRTDLVVIPLVLIIELFVFSTVVRDGTLSAFGRWGIIGYAVVGVLLLVIRYRAPIPVFAALWVHAMVAYLFIPGFYPVLTLLVALAAVAELCSIPVSLGALGAAMIPSALAVGYAVREASPAGAGAVAIASTIFYSLLNGLAWGIGRWSGANRRHVLALQAEHRALVAEQLRQAEHAISEERLRIARELHDIVAHSVTIMVLHAAGAQRVLMSDPVRAGEALSTIEESGKQAMGELRRLLGVLRESDASGLPALPLQGLAHLEVVLGSVRSSGVIVEVEVYGEPQPLDPSIDLAAFRLVQEGLTNVTKHVGAGARAVVSIDWGSDTATDKTTDKVTIAVEDDGPGGVDRPAALSTGNGLTGLAERITIAGGDFAAGPTESGGFRVAARLPVSAVNVASGRQGETTRPEREPRRTGRPTTAHGGIPEQPRSAESEGQPSEVADFGVPGDDTGRSSGSVAGYEP